MNDLDNRRLGVGDLPRQALSIELLLEQIVARLRSSEASTTDLLSNQCSELAAKFRTAICRSRRQAQSVLDKESHASNAQLNSGSDEWTADFHSTMDEVTGEFKNISYYLGELSRHVERVFRNPSETADVAVPVTSSRFTRITKSFPKMMKRDSTPVQQPILAEPFPEYEQIKLDLDKVQTFLLQVIELWISSKTVRNRAPALEDYCKAFDDQFGNFNHEGEISLIHCVMLNRIIREDQDPLCLSSLKDDEKTELCDFVETLLSQRAVLVKYLNVLIGPAFSATTDSVNSQPMDVVRGWLQRSQVRLAINYNVIPRSIFLDGITLNHGYVPRSGGFADVHEARFNGEVIALKRIRVYNMTAPKRAEELTKAFYQEFLTWRTLKHPRILPVFGLSTTIFTNALGPCIVMEWIEQGNTRYVLDIRRSDMPEPQLRVLIHTWLKQIIEGLIYLHSHNVAHGDLRAVNVLVNNRDEIYLSDFGLSVFIEGRRKRYASIHGGAHQWLPPEAFINAEAKDFRSTTYADVYSFACVCIEFHTGEDPFESFSLLEMGKVILSGTRPERPTSFRINDDLWSIMQDCWREEPTERPSAEKLSSLLSTL